MPYLLLIFGFLCVLPTAGKAQNRHLEEVQARVKSLLKTENYDSVASYCQQILAQKQKTPKITLYAYTTLISLYQDTQLKTDKYHEFVQKAIALAQELKDWAMLADIYLRLGNHYYNSEKFAQALGSYQLAIRYFHSIGKTEKVAHCWRLLGILFAESLHKYDSAYHYLEKSLQVFEAKNAPAEILATYGFLGNCARSEKQWDKALQYYEKGYQIALSTENALAKAQICYSIACAYNEQKKYPKTIEYSEKAFGFAQEANHIIMAINSLRVLHNALFESQQFQRAYQTLDLYHKYEDSLHEKQSKERLHTIEKQFQNKEQKKEIAQQRNEIAQQNFYIQVQYIAGIVMAVGFLFISGLTFFLFRLNNEKHQINRALSEQKKQIEEKNTEILDSIAYAERIQNAILPRHEHIAQLLGMNNFFILHKPRDIVSGDFYWVEGVENSIIVACADCTGHGVPGAFMSMIGAQILHEIVFQQGFISPELILEELHRAIRHTLKQAKTCAHDGMDIAVCVLQPQARQVLFAGARSHIFYVQAGEGKRLRGDNLSIGGEQREIVRTFTLHTIPLLEREKTYFYMFTDGFQDQFGGERNKKFSSQRLMNLLQQNHTLPAHEQMQTLENELTTWIKQSNEMQIDDITLLGFAL